MVIDVCLCVQTTNGMMYQVYIHEIYIFCFVQFSFVLVAVVLLVLLVLLFVLVVLVDDDFRIMQRVLRKKVDRCQAEFCKISPLDHPHTLLLGSPRIIFCFVFLGVEYGEYGIKYGASIITYRATHIMKTRAIYILDQKRTIIAVHVSRYHE